ncbi:HPP family protein [Ectopseudomonas guguanensis]|jgi:CBS-domain-containing membrane protein|uniref:HPP family protein n=1 Tax=Ectopseudomonas guguanensis TaxID=1198456 RepID=UPI0012D4DFDF|nr:MULTISPECIES: HPP family protein [Pseudomonas]MPT19648.1 HPP family protein [Pseudomonas sp.]WJH57332.1 HPP family protein [Pseudomonas guguanensis]
MLSFLGKLRGDGAALPPPPSLRQVLLAWLGGFLAIACIAGSGDALSISLLLGSFGASCVLVFGFPDLPFSQPRNLVLGHVLSSLVGLICLHLLGPGIWSLALAVSSAIALMMLTRSVHPPAGSNPVIIFLTQPGWGFLFFPTLAGALILLLVALLYNNATRSERYPRYW